MSLNKVILIGRLGRDPELRFTPSGQAVATFTLATNETWTNRDGVREERTEWHRIVVWGKQAEIVSNYLGKGRLAYVEGSIRTRTWTDRNGVEQRTTEIIAQRVLFLDSRSQAEAQPDVPPPPSPSSQPRQVVEPVPEPPPDLDEVPTLPDDDIPF